MGQLQHSSGGGNGSAMIVAKTDADKAARAVAMMIGDGLSGLIDKALPPAFKDGSARLKTAVMMTYRQTPKLAACSPDSQKLAILKVAATGLELGDEAFLIPRKGEATVQIGYQGWCQLIRRHPAVADVYARTVYEHETFSIDLGENTVRHEPNYRGSRGAAVGYYAVLKLRNGERQVYWMSRDDVEDHKRRYITDPGPAWKTSFDAMACKTVLLQIKRFAPRSRDIALGEVIEHAKSAMVTEGEKDLLISGSGGYDAQTGEYTDAEPTPLPAPVADLPNRDNDPGAPAVRGGPKPKPTPEPFRDPETHEIVPDGAPQGREPGQEG